MNYWAPPITGSAAELNMETDKYLTANVLNILILKATLPWSFQLDN